MAARGREEGVDDLGAELGAASDADLTVRLLEPGRVGVDLVGAHRPAGLVQGRCVDLDDAVDPEPGLSLVLAGAKRLELGLAVALERVALADSLRLPVVQASVPSDAHTLTLTMSERCGDRVRPAHPRSRP